MDDKQQDVCDMARDLLANPPKKGQVMTDAEWIKLIERHNDGNGNITITKYWWDSYKARLKNGIKPMRFEIPKCRHEGHPYA